MGEVADLVEVRGPQTALDVDQPPPLWMRAPLEVRRERVHAGRGEEDRVRGRRQERATGDQLVPAFAVEVEERTDDVVGVHGGESFGSGGDRKGPRGGVREVWK